MIYQQINNGESGSTVRAKLNAMLSALITGAEGNNELWRALNSLKQRMVSLSEEELTKQFNEIIRQNREYTDTKVDELTSYFSAASGLVDVAVSLDYTPKFSKEQGGLVLTSLYGEFPNLHLTIPQPTGPHLFILYKAAGSEEWRYSSVSLGVTFDDKWGTSTNAGITQKFLTENTLHKDALVEGFSTEEDKVINAAFNTKVTNVLNVDILYPLASGNYTSNTARKAIPETLRKQGLIITYYTTKGQVLEQFIGSSPNWENDSLWVNVVQKFKVLPFHGFVDYSGNIESGEPANLNDSLIEYDEQRKRFLYSYNDKKYLVGDSRYTAQGGIFPENIMYVSFQGVIFSSVNSTKVVKYGLPVIVDNLETDDATKVLSAAQGVRIKELISEGHLFFGVLSKDDVSFGNHSTKGFYILKDGGEYPNVTIEGKPLVTTAYSLLLVDKGNLEVIKAPAFALQKDLSTLQSTVEAFETTKTKVLSEEEYNTLQTDGSLESDRLYFTFEA